MDTDHLNFKPQVPVFDANVSLGRLTTRKLAVDNLPETLDIMNRNGIDKSLVYSTHSMNFDTGDGNQLLLESIGDDQRFIPMFGFNPATLNLLKFKEIIEKHQIRAIQTWPLTQNYPLTEWIIGDWLNWIQEYNLTLFMSASEIDPRDFYNIFQRFNKIKVVLTEVHYSHISWVIPLLSNLENVSLEISKFYINDGLKRLLDIISYKRILYGSNFPYQPMGPQLYNLHKSDIDTTSLTAICSGNLEELLRNN